MAAQQAEVVGQDVAVERLTELSAERAAAYSTGQRAEDGTRHGSEGDADRSGDSAERCAGLAARQSSADASRSTAHGTDGGADFHGVME
ncbi:hypothetical protein D9M70_556520 [compost metagenome]